MAGSNGAMRRYVMTDGDKSTPHKPTKVVAGSGKMADEFRMPPPPPPWGGGAGNASTGSVPDQ